MCLCKSRLVLLYILWSQFHDNFKIKISKKSSNNRFLIEKSRHKTNIKVPNVLVLFVYSGLINNIYIFQMQGDGRGYQCLVALTKTFESLALKCLMNLCYLFPCRPLLGTAGLVECLVGILQKNSG